MTIRLATLLLLAAPLLAVPALAASQSEVAAQGDAAVYDDLADTILAATDLVTMQENLMATMGRQLLADPEFAQLELESPGLVSEMLGEMRPILTQMMADTMPSYRTEASSLFARNLSVDEARRLSEFYRSPIGSKLLASASRNFTGENVAAQAMRDEAFTDKSFMADTVASMDAVIGELSAEEMTELARIGRSEPALRKLVEIGPELIQLQLSLANGDATPEEEAALEAAIERVFKRRFPEDYQD